MASKCTSCGATVQPQAVFCQICGQRVDAGDVSSPAPAAATAPTSQGAADTPVGPGEMLKGAAQRSDPMGYPAETELWEGSYSPKAMIGTWIVSDVLCVVLLIAVVWFGGQGMLWGAIGLIVVVNLFLGLVLLYRISNVHYRLTSQRFVHQRGLLRRVTDRIEVIDFDDITFTQGIVDRMVNTGTILIVSGDPTDPKLALPGIENVAQVAALMDDARRAERRRRGLHIDQR